MRSIGPRDGLRGGRLPEHRQVLVARHRHLHDRGQPAAPAAAASATWSTARPLGPPGPRRAPPRGRGRRARWACASWSSPPWRATTCPTAARRTSRAPSTPLRERLPDCRVEVLIPDLRGAGARSRPSSRPRPTCSTTTPRPCHASTRACARGRATSARWSCWRARPPPGLTTKSGIMVGLGETPRRRSAQVLSDLAARGLRAGHGGPVPAPLGGPPAGGALLRAGRVPGPRRAGPRAWASPTWRPDRWCARRSRPTAWPRPPSPPSEPPAPRGPPLKFAPRGSIPNPTVETAPTAARDGGRCQAEDGRP